MAPWDAGRPVSARGRYYVLCPINSTTTLEENAGRGAAGDELDWLWLFPQSTTPAGMSLKDGSTVVWSWPAGVTLTDARPIFVPLNLRALSGAWSVTTPATFTVTAAGAFG